MSLSADGAAHKRASGMFSLARPIGWAHDLETVAWVIQTARLTLSPLFSGERVGVRGSHARHRKLLPLTLTLSPLKCGERERDAFHFG